MTTDQIPYRGFIISWETPKSTGHIHPVQISTPDLELRARLGVDAYQTSQVSLDDAIMVAKTVIDKMLDGIGPEERAG